MGGPPLASWAERAGAYLIDAVAPGVAVFVLTFVAALISDSFGSAMNILGNIGSLVFAFWNLARQGRTGQTVGKQVVGIRLLREADGGVVGPGLSIGRAFLHIVDAVPCMVGFLWPLWDQKRQTFADKILSTLVVKG